MNKILFSFFITMAAGFVQAQETVTIIPQPAQIHLRQENFRVNEKTVIAASKGYKKEARYLQTAIQAKTGMYLTIAGKKPGSNFIFLDHVATMKEPEGYGINISSKEALIQGTDQAGVFRGIQTLLQVIKKEEDGKIFIPGMVVFDYPRFAYRGMHLDVSRHFFSLDYVKKYVDYLAMYKFNTFHWHLIDDQGWRIEIKKYPALNMFGGWRNGTIIGRYPGTGNDNTPHGGFYTQEEIKELVNYAADRHITVIPEIEMPGHASAALAAYPKLGCTGGPYKVQETWGVFEEVFCAGNDSTFLFLEGVLDEVMALFPSKLIHIGGDECPKESWKKCELCQQRIKDKNLKDEHELQSYFIRRIEKYVNSKGKNIIGWDEILEGGLAPNASVMSWRGEEGGIEAAKQHHFVVMTPGSHCYFDHTQSRNEDSVTIGGYTPVEKVYDYEPVPKELGPDLEKYVMGAQANLWTEYIDNFRKVEYMIFPRMLALSEVLWSQKTQRNWKEFEPRMQTHIGWLNKAGINYSKAYFDLSVSVKQSKTPGTLLVKLATKKKDGLIRLQYQTHLQELVEGKKTNTELLLLNEQGESTLEVKNSGWRQFTWFTGTDSSRPVKLNFDFNYATGQKITLKEPPAKKYPGEDGANGLVNGIVSERGIASPEWLGWEGPDMEAVIELPAEQKISKVTIHTLEQQGSWIYLPQSAEIFTSKDGVNFIPAGKSSTFTPDRQTMKNLTVSFSLVKTRFIKILVRNFGIIPSGKPGAGHKAWLFVDEVRAF